MTHYLRHNEKTIVDVEATQKDFHVLVLIPAFSELLLESEDRPQVIHDFSAIQEMRGAYWEGHMHQRPPREMPNEFVERCLKTMAAKYKLSYVTD